ncbi:MAG: hypothetical protein Q7T57_00395 [Dehalococcoidales bacterium]|nr:hypothetical protein [Dehalococcoidales bacterium]
MVMMKRVLGLLVAFVSVVLFIGGGTIAYFGTVAVNASNMPDTGKLHLATVQNSSADYSFQVPNVAPGDSGYGRKRLVNDGSRSGMLGVGFSPIVNTPGTFGEYADNSGDLGANVQTAVYIDVDTSGDWSNGDIGLKTDGGTYSYPSALKFDAINDYGSIIWNSITTIVASVKFDFIIVWQVPITVGNEIQGDSASFDITFFLE